MADNPTQKAKNYAEGAHGPDINTRAWGPADTGKRVNNWTDDWTDEVVETEPVEKVIMKPPPKKPTRKRKIGRSHVGGRQMPLFPPDVSWTAPSELPDLRGRPMVALDSETRDNTIKKGGLGPGWPFKAGYVAGVSAAWRQEGGGYEFIYVPIQHPDTSGCFSREQVARWLKDIADSGTHLLFQNASYDLGWFRADLDLDLRDAKIDDTIAAATLVDENRLNYNLESLCKWRGVPGKDEAILRDAAAAYDIDPKAEMWRLPGRYVAQYAAQDPVATLGLLESLWPVMEAEGTVGAYQLEMDIVPMVLEMRLRGVRVDLEAAERAIATIDEMRDKLLYEMARELDVNAVSVKDCRSSDFMEKMFRKFKLDFPVLDSGHGSFRADWMRDSDHWFPKMASRITQLTKASDTFIRDHIVGHTVNGRLHASINQYRGEDGEGARTLRFSYSDPPLQQMPARDDDLAALIRGCFIPEEGEKWMSADFSQQELRLMVHYAVLAGLTRAEEAAELYRNDPNTDFHKMVIDWTGLPRKPAKGVTFGKAFGAGTKKMVMLTHMPEDETIAICRKYDDELPFVSQLSKMASGRAGFKGFIVLVDGARSHFDMWERRRTKLDWERIRNGEYVPYEPARPKDLAIAKWGKGNICRADTRKAMSRLIQGSAARQTKMAMRACWQEARYVPLIQLHDSLDFSLARQQDGSRIVELMQDCTPLQLPSKVDAGYGIDWGQATHDVPDGEEWRQEWDHVPARVG